MTILPQTTAEVKFQRKKLTLVSPIQGTLATPKKKDFSATLIGGPPSVVEKEGLANESSTETVQQQESSPGFNALKVLPANIPQELKDHPHWAVWEADQKPNGKYTKPPRDAKNGYLKTNAPEDWLPFDQALTAYATGKWDGIGILLTPDDHFIGVDVDGCGNSADENFSAGQDIVRNLGTYSEVSPSGTGIRCIGMSDKSLSLDGNKENGVEFYTENRFLTITGHILSGHGQINTKCEPEFLSLHQRYIVEKRAEKQRERKEAGERSSGKLSDYLRDTTPSGKDFELCRTWFEQGYNVNEVRVKLVSEGSNQEKYHRDDYLDRTVAAACLKVNSNQDVKRLPNIKELTYIDHRAVANKQFEEPDWLIKGLILKSTIVAQIVGEQQVGKSFFLALLAYCLAAGRSYGSLIITKPRRVLYLNVEDPLDQMERRCKAIQAEMKFTAEEIELIEENLFISASIGQFRTIINSSGKETDDFARLEHEVKKCRPDLVIGDTKSRLAGGEENSNDAQAALVRLLEQLVYENNCVFLMAHHPNKTNATSSRGGSAWESNVRLTINLTKLTANEGKPFGIPSDEASSRCYKVVANDNYGGKSETYFKKDADSGFPRPLYKSEFSTKLVEEWLYQALKDHGPVKKRLLEQNRQGSDAVVAKMLETFPEINIEKKKAISDAITALIADDRIYEIQNGRSTILSAQRPRGISSERMKKLH